MVDIALAFICGVCSGAMIGLYVIVCVDRLKEDHK